MKTITINKKDKRLSGTLRLPASKSLSNRLLIIQALSKDNFSIKNLSEADDTLLLQDLLQKIREQRYGQSLIELDTANAGTVMRFLTAFLARIKGKWILTGSDRMKQRPVGILVEAVRSLGADIEYLGKLGYPPLMIKGKPLQGNEIKVDAGISSQFISALILIAPALPGGLTLCLQGQTVSFPYINMTLRLLNYFGIETRKERNKIIIPESGYTGKDFVVEADWSAASFWYEAAALAEEADLVLEGLEKDSLQGDAILVDIYQNFGVSTEFTKAGIHLTKVKKKLDGFFFDFTDHPDIALAVITTCAALGLRGRFEGLKSLPLKETNRLKALENEYSKLGLHLHRDTVSDPMPVIEFSNPKFISNNDLRIYTYGDHRMAMTFAPLSLKLGNIRIEDPDVVSKSYPQFWENLASLGFDLS
jgi:3-phosphoshikimate 1-carboxyvinyltransferase